MDPHVAIKRDLFVSVAVNSSMVRPQQPSHINNWHCSSKVRKRQHNSAAAIVTVQHRSDMATQTVLIVGATGNIGVAAVKGALQAGRNVLAIVRNQNSADKLTKHVGNTEGITFVEADIGSDSGVKDVVTKVRQGKLPAFQHVYSSGMKKILRIIAGSVAKPLLSRCRVRYGSSREHHHGPSALQLQHFLRG